MRKEIRSLLVWLIVLITVVSSSAVFLSSLPDYSHVVKVNYGEFEKDKTAVTTRSATKPSVVQFPININTASKEDLMCIKGIGDVYAERIIAFREENGGFSSIEQLTEIQGIGEKRLESWREYLVCE